jgi:hypothetical protein
MMDVMVRKAWLSANPLTNASSMAQAWPGDSVEGLGLGLGLGLAEGDEALSGEGALDAVVGLGMATSVTLGELVGCLAGCAQAGGALRLAYQPSA